MGEERQGLRILGLAGAPNTRDIGGLTSADGRRVRTGLVFRAPALGRLTGTDIERLGELGLRTVVDLRDASEIELVPPDRLPEPAPEVCALPIYDPEHPVFTYVSAVLLGKDAGSDFEALAEEGTPGAMLAIYRWFVHGELARERFAAAVRLLADPDRLPAMVHCSAGKDRTGWLTAILLTILGAGRPDIEADYLATNEAAAEANEAVLAALRVRRPQLSEEVVRPVFEARAEYLAAAYGEVDRLYQSFDRYLRDGLGLDAGVLDALRRNLLD